MNTTEYNAEFCSEGFPLRCRRAKKKYMDLVFNHMIQSRNSESLHDFLVRYYCYDTSQKITHFKVKQNGSKIQEKSCIQNYI